jgi:formylglycine-generating enzyme required for sulfatase activity
MKRILVIALMLSLVGTLSLLAQEVKPGKTGVIDLGNDVKLEMLLIPAGKFKMGDPGKDHEVTLTKPFYMGKYEVTQEQWEVIMGENPSTKKD